MTIPETDADTAHPEDSPYRLELRPHRSATLQAIHIVLGLMVLLFVPTAIAFTVAGAWPVMGFMGLELVLLYAALRLNHHRGALVETIAIDRRQFSIERVNPWGRRQSWRFQPQWLQVGIYPEARATNRLELRSHGRALAIAQFLTPDERIELAETLRRQLARLTETADPAPIC